LANLAVATFIMNSEAVRNIGRHFQSALGFADKRDPQEEEQSFSETTSFFGQLLSRFADGFDTYYRLAASAPLRMIWRPHQQTAGILYIARDDELRSISLILSGINRKNDVSAIEELGRALSPVDEYFESLAVVRFAGRPIVATYRRRGCGQDRTVDSVQSAFADAFFKRCGLLH
jgi:hypothetical protein